MKMQEYRFIQKDRIYESLFGDEKPNQISSDDLVTLLFFFLNQEGKEEYIKRERNIDLFEFNGEFYNINISDATITFVSLIIDILITQGALSAVLAGTGTLKPFLEKISTINGEFCNLIELSKFSTFKVGSETAILNNLSNQECPYEKFNCIHKSDRICTLTIDGLKDNLNQFIEKGFISINSEGFWELKIKV
jgi:hypothetical protein